MSIIIESLIATVTNQLKASSKAVIALSGPQGSGKTTCAKRAAQSLTDEFGVSTMAISLDDFYKPYTELQQIAKRGNPLLQHRGLPGTHDYDLLLEFLNKFKSNEQSLKVPTYDKSLNNGAGDRSGFVDVPETVQAVILEGWMVGFRPIGENNVQLKYQAMPLENWSITPSLTDLLEVDMSLEAYISIWETFDNLFKMVPNSMEYVYKWRLQQEQELRAVRGTGMTDEQVKQFVDQYMPCYYLYGDTMQRVIEFDLDIDHVATKR